MLDDTMSVPVEPTVAAYAFLSGCVQAGMRHVVLSPGSRSTPLSLGALEVAGLTHSIHLDERTAAFSALGRARVTGRPVGLICTSGTAAANYLPALAESNQSNLPIVAITADRPPEHQAWGVGQTFDQTHLFGGHATFVGMPVGGEAGIDHAVRAGWRCVETAWQRSAPVHVNWPFRMPLEPTGAPMPPLTQLPPAQRAVRAWDFDAPELLDARHGVIVAGPASVRGDDDADAIRELAAQTGWPIIADVLSGLRGRLDAMLIPAADRVVAAGPPGVPDVVLRFGDTPTAKSVRLWWEAVESQHVLVDPLHRWHDPSHLSTRILRCDPRDLLGRLTTSAPSAWAESWLRAGRRARVAVDTTLDDWSPWTEAHVARSISRDAPPARTVVVSSSMPVRDLDSFGEPNDTRRVVANRGINGIDGVIATAIGAAQALDERVIVHIGDVALLHDLGSLLDATRTGVDLTVVVPDNDGGGIFSYLPIHDAIPAETHRKIFHTPHGTDLSFLGAHPSIHHETVDAASFGAALLSAENRPGVSLLVARVSTADALALHRAVGAATAQAVAHE